MAPLQPLGTKSGHFASAEDYNICKRLHRLHGTTYYFATQRFRPEFRRRVNALYGFVRVADEIVDEIGSEAIESRAARLEAFRQELIDGTKGIRPNEPALRAFCDVMRECAMPLDEPLIFLAAMRQDLTQSRYNTYDDLVEYMRGSAAAVGVMMCYVLGVGHRPETIKPAMALGNAMQLTNFLRDVGEDLERGRIYLPQEDLAHFGVYEDELTAGMVTDRFRALMQFEIERARNLYADAEPGISLLPAEAQKAVKLAHVLYGRILDRIEMRHYDVFTGRARTSSAEKVLVAARVLVGLA